MISSSPLLESSFNIIVCAGAGAGAGAGVDTFTNANDVLS